MIFYPPDEKCSMYQKYLYPSLVLCNLSNNKTGKYRDKCYSVDLSFKRYYATNKMQVEIN